MRHHLKISPKFLCRGTLHSGNIAYRIGFLYQTAMEWGSNSHFFSAKKIPGQFPGKNSVSISPKAGTIPSPIEGRPKYWFIQKNICPD
ncbi:hypothetical protein SAMN02744778_00711 [Pantoea sp. GL120224-02]|nr:hypothetical protein SAMN02744778_00711 [Pantoea sp. GL120224-02]